MRADTARKSSLAAAVVSAVAASACCVGPLAFGTLGLGGAGLLVAMEPYRPLFAVATLGLLAVGFFVTYRPPAQADDCGCESPRTHRTGRWLLWGATLVAVLALASPSLLAFAGAGSTTASMDRALAPATSLTSTTIKVEGMTCASCEGAIRKVVRDLSGVHSVEVSFDSATATVEYDPVQVTANSVAEAITRLGYPSTVQPLDGT